MLLHLQLPLPLDTNSPHSGIFLASTVQELLVPLFANIHALAEVRGQAIGFFCNVCGVGLFDVGYQGRGVCHVGHFAIGVRGFGDREVGSVGAELGAGYWFSGEGLVVAHGLRWWRGVEGAVVA